MFKASEPPYHFNAEFTLSGILESDYMGYSNSGMVTAIAGQGTANDLLPNKYNVASVDFKLKDLKGFQNEIDNLALALNL